MGLSGKPHPPVTPCVWLMYKHMARFFTGMYRGDKDNDDNAVKQRAAIVTG